MIDTLYKYFMLPAVLIIKRQFDKINTLGVIFFCLILVLLYSLYYFNKIHFDDTAFFGGDTWEYQSMAVNWAKGYGLKFGGIEPFETYKFTEINSDVTPEGKIRFLTNCKENSCQIDTYGTPGYPIFLGVIYKFFGVHPQIVKQIQLILLIIVASFLPLIGWYFWGNVGAISGVISSCIFLEKCTHPSLLVSLSLPSHILTEPLITFFMFLTIIAYILWHKYQNLTTIALLGLIIGSSLLVKGSNVFIPAITFGLFFYHYLKKQMRLIDLSIFLIFVLSTIIPWSIYASVSKGQIIILSTQGRYTLFAGNNEYSTDGTWHPEGYTTNPNSYYRQSWLQKYSDFLKVIFFYFQHPRNVIPTFFNKIHQAFWPFSGLKICLLLICYSLTLSLSCSPKLKAIATIISLYCLSAFLLSPISTSQINIYHQPHARLYLTPILFLLTLVLLFFNFRQSRKVNLDVPLIFFILFINFFLVTITTFGLPRYIQVIDFIFILTGTKYLLSFLCGLYASLIGSFRSHQWQE